MGAGTSTARTQRAALVNFAGKPALWFGLGSIYLPAKAANPCSRTFACFPSALLDMTHSSAAIFSFCILLFYAQEKLGLRWFFM